MKKYYVILGAILCLLQVEISGQDTLRIEDIFKKGKKQSSGQQNNRKKTTNLEIENSAISLAIAIDPYIMVVETRYQITKDGKYYGKEDLPYYGKKLGIAFAQGRELWMDPLMVKPWTIDPDFENYKTEYDAELQEMLITSVKYGKKYEVSGKDAASRINSNGFGVTSTGGKTYIGLTRSTSQTPSGMLILYFLGVYNNPDSLVKKVIFMSPEWNEGRAMITTPKDSGFLGGVYMECVPQDGKILFRFAGMVVGNLKNPSTKEILSIIASPAENQKPPERQEAPSKETNMDRPQLQEVDKKGKGGSSKK
ncbi:MAG: hypothetical protein IPJ53_03475 [Saprospiraceae bacterium]|nr:hypothetical protein [Candidatus Vicinibacter affinis]